MENGILKQEINYLKTIVANVEIERDEAEIKNESLERSLVLLENKLETEYTESKKYKDAFSKIKDEQENVNDDLQIKIEQISHWKESIEKLTIDKSKVENKLNQSEESRMMLENVVESKSDKVAELESKVQYLSSKTAIPCDKCENTFVSKDTSSDHNAIPTTSKCGSCEFESDSENEIQMHMKSGHDLLRSVCDFESENKLNMHTCRLDVINPEYGDYYTKN